PGMCPAANSCGSRTSTITREPSASPAATVSRSRSITVVMPCPRRRQSRLRRFEREGGRLSFPAPQDKCISQKRTPRRTAGANHASGERRNAQHLARIDLVRVRQHRLVGLEDEGVLGTVALAVVALGDL